MQSYFHLILFLSPSSQSNHIKSLDLSNSLKIEAFVSPMYVSIVWFSGEKQNEITD